MNNLIESQEAFEDGYYDEQLGVGNEFEKFITKKFKEYRGVEIGMYTSREDQILHGENKFGMEIKRDGQFRKTRNLYFELAEKSHPNNPDYMESGILREDNTWLFLIGDEENVWIFCKKRLRSLVRQYSNSEVITPTSIGFLMTIKDAHLYCSLYIDFTVPPPAHLSAPDVYLLPKATVPFIIPKPVIVIPSAMDITPIPQSQQKTRRHNNIF